jgi:splicing factor U2AF subunit
MLQSYASLEMRSVEEASNAMALDGVVYKDTNLKVRLSAMYDEMLMLALPLCR